MAAKNSGKDMMKPLTRSNNKQTNSPVPVNTNPMNSTTNSDNEVCQLLKSLSSKVSGLDKKFDSVHNDLAAKLEQESNNIRTDFHQRFDSFTNKITAIETDIERQSERVNKVEDEIETNNRIKRLNDVVLRGVPNDMKDLHAMFGSISAAIKFQPTKFECLNNIFRIGNKNNGSYSSPIVVQFTTQLYKREFMNCYFTYGQLNQSDIGCPTNSRIYASDNLTKTNGTIHYKALQLLKSKQIWKAQIKSGLVFVQFSESINSMVKINSLDDLPAPSNSVVVDDGSNPSDTIVSNAQTSN